MTTPATFPIGTKHPIARPPQLPFYQPPTTPEEVAREKERISLLLEINVALLQHTTGLQAQGLGGVLGTQQQHGETMSETKNPSEDYVKCMRCISSNIAYLTAAATLVRNRPGTLAGPAIMEPPDSLASLVESYDKLKVLFPDWPGIPTQGTATRPTSMSGGIGTQGMGSGQNQSQNMAKGMGYPGPSGMGMGMGMGPGTGQNK